MRHRNRHAGSSELAKSVTVGDVLPAGTILNHRVPYHTPSCGALLSSGNAFLSDRHLTVGRFQSFRLRRTPIARASRRSGRSCQSQFKCFCPPPPQPRSYQRPSWAPSFLHQTDQIAELTKNVALGSGPSPRLDVFSLASCQGGLPWVPTVGPRHLADLGHPQCKSGAPDSRRAVGSTVFPSFFLLPQFAPYVRSHGP